MIWARNVRVAFEEGENGLNFMVILSMNLIMFLVYIMLVGERSNQACHIAYLKANLVKV